MPSDKTPSPVILGRYAGFFSRGAAYVLDRFFISVITSIIVVVIDYILRLFRLDQWLESLNESAAFSAGLVIILSAVGINILVSFWYDIGFWVASGQTPGKRVLGVRVMRADGTRLTLGRAFLRRIGYWLSSTVFFLGFLWILVDNKRQGWHDKLGGTIVTYSWPEGRLRGTFVIKSVQRFTDMRAED